MKKDDDIMRVWLTVALSVFLLSLSNAQIANHVVISEVSPMKGNSTTFNSGEFIELYNPTLADITFGTSVQMISGNISGTNNAEWQLSLSGRTIKAHGFLLIGDGGVAGRDTSFPSNKNLANSGTRSCVQLRDGSTIVDAFAWDPALAPLLSSEGIQFSPSSTTTDGKSFERRSSSSTTGPDTLGNGYDTDNNATDFFENIAANANPQNSLSVPEPALPTGGNGTGSGSIFPSNVKALDSAAFKISIWGDGAHIIDSLIILVPNGWSWGQSTANITVAGGGIIIGRVSVLGDTIYVGGAAITSTDTGKITISYIKAPNISGLGFFKIWTRSQEGMPAQISDLIVSIERITPIIEIHVNDAQGVPKAPYSVGAIVTVSGIVTADLTSTRTDIYVQDGTAGINIFKSTRSFDYHVGDSVTVTGTITQFRGLTEIGLDSTKYIVHANGLNLPQPLLITAAEVNSTFNTEDFTEQNEGRLVRIESVTYNSANSTISDETGTTNVFIPSSLTAPNSVFDLVGILKQFKPGTPAPGPPYLTDYEIQPRTQGDIILHPGPVIMGSPVETDITPDSVAIVWSTQANASGFVRYGLTSAYTDSVGRGTAEMEHRFVLRGLRPSTIYHYQVGSTDINGVNVTGDRIFSTSSPSASGGTINVYFSKTINSTVALAETAQTVDISSKLVTRINAAAHSIDVCLYSLSGNVGANIAGALIAAKSRGVQIRVIGEKDNQGTAPWSTLKNNGITVIDDAYDPVNAGSGLMHNKFVIFDNRDSSSAADDWVWMGSWNATDPGNNYDAQNVLEVNDQALANAYTMEFNEMWGSTSDTPNQTLSRFGLRKTDNTPHRFNIKSTPMELYFSPSDRTTSQIQAALSMAQSSLNIGLLTFTQDDLAQVLIAKKGAGKKVRVILDNNTDNGNEFVNLANGNVDVRLKASSLGGLFHHKYAIIDAENSSVENVVITGSHNWSNSAETSNNENTLIIHSKRIANLYLQEFKQRYIDAGGTDPIVVTSVQMISGQFPQSFSLAQNYPNPFNPGLTKIEFQLAGPEFVVLKVFDMLGREVAVLMNEQRPAGAYKVTWDASSVASGVYFYSLHAGSFSAVKKMILLK